MKHTIFENLKPYLSTQGIAIEDIQVVKNGIVCRGIRIVDSKNTKISPIVYYSEHDTLEAISAKILDVIRSGMTDLDTSLFSDPEYILGNAYIAVRRKYNDDSVKRDCMNLDACVRVLVPVDNDSQFGSYAMTRTLVAQVGISEEDLWNAAIQNSCASIEIRSMNCMLGLPETGEPTLFVVTSDSSRAGAGALAVKNIFREFCKTRHENGCYILPSSTEDLIVLPFSHAKGIRPEDMCHMTESVNAECVDLHLQLDPVCYRFSLLSDKLEVAASADRR